jgi:hypothetical protein
MNALFEMLYSIFFLLLTGAWPETSLFPVTADEGSCNLSTD